MNIDQNMLILYGTPSLFLVGYCCIEKNIFGESSKFSFDLFAPS